LILVAAAPDPAQKIKPPEKPRAGEAPRGAVLSGPKILDSVQALCGNSVDTKGKKIALWQPGPADIARLEDRLPGFMRTQKTPFDYQPLHEYYRQYVGVSPEGKKKICVNFFHHGFLLDSLRVEPDLPSDYWKYEPVHVDDGGAYFFHLQFDLETGTFTNLRFNGYA
jgi:hypothetical protein